jgi:hypothetical protein
MGIVPEVFRVAEEKRRVTAYSIRRIEPTHRWRLVTLKLKLVAAAGLAATALGAGALVTAPTASAMPRSCAVARELARSYISTAWVLWSLGDYASSAYWRGKAEGVVEAACG